MKLKVISDGMANSTRVVNAETGEQLEGVIGVRWTTHRDDAKIAFVEITLEWQDVAVTPNYMPGRPVTPETN